MKKIFFLLLPLLTALPIFANEIVIEEQKSEMPSFSIETEDITKVANENKATNDFDMDAFKQKKKITDGLLWGSAAFSSAGVSILVASIIMGFIPKESFPDEMFTDVAFEIENIYSDGSVRMSSYPSMMVYCCVGATLFCVGTFIVLFALPILFYSIVRKVNEYKFEKTLKEEPHWEVSAAGVQYKF